MGETTGISWADSTFNIVWGCLEVSPACDHCYARSVAERWGFDIWGKDKPRRQMSEHYWNDPIRWNRAAEKSGVRRRVFCSSMADVFEDHADVATARERLWPLIAKTPMLDWMLLTKRPALMTKFAPKAWADGWPSNVWAGTTAENQEFFDKRWPILKKVPAKIKWISAEPLLSDIVGDYTGISWMIVGGESGAGARRMAPEWANNILVRCTSSGTKYFMKQKGSVLAAELGCKDKVGKDPSEWPLWMQVQEFPDAA